MLIYSDFVSSVFNLLHTPARQTRGFGSIMKSSKLSRRFIRCIITWSKLTPAAQKKCHRKAGVAFIASEVRLPEALGMIPIARLTELIRVVTSRWTSSGHFEATIKTKCNAILDKHLQNCFLLRHGESMNGTSCLLNVRMDTKKGNGCRQWSQTCL